MQHRKNAGI
jgi:hypothetical protein